ncbi:hypothetical protein SISSUDRAFT_992175, partial [Sistotremastrum suecicum HHB10207 ss-3]
ELEYESLNPERILQIIEGDAQKVVNISGLELGICQILCRVNRWNTEHLLDKYMDSPGSTLATIGDRWSASQDCYAPPPSKRVRRNQPAEFVCDICCMTPDEGETFKPRCGHEFCKDCWGYYLDTKVTAGECLIKCMGEACKVVLVDSDVKANCSEKSWRLYQKLISQMFVKSNSHLRFCPFPECDQAVSCRDISESSLNTLVPTVYCVNEHPFCFGCGMDCDHRPVICKIAAIWLRSAKEDSGTSQWLKANTRPCPKCKQMIEKNGGCNRIMCQNCKHQFCWVCKADWSSHGYNNSTCNAFKESDKADHELEAGSKLERWLHYFDRYNNHELSARLDEQLYERTEEKIVEVQKASGLSWIQAQFMKNAVVELTQCRTTLKWTYSMAFYMKAGNSKEMFEDIQADLEKSVEDLSQMLEIEIEDINVAELRQKMIDKTVYVRKRRDIVLEDTAKGLQDGRWEWMIALD